MFQGKRTGRFVEQIRAGRCELPDLAEPFRSMLVGEAFGVTAVALESLEIAVGGVFVGLFEVCGDGSMNERCVGLFERPERVPEAVHLHPTPLGKTNCWWTY
jgi:hypothetical protein